MRSRPLAFALFFVGCSVVLGADQLKPRVNVDFGVGLNRQHAPRNPTVTPQDPEAVKKQLEDAAKLKVTQLHARHSATLEGFDCRMVQPVDPNYRSAMPVVTPRHPSRFAMKVIEAPPCREAKR